MDPGLRYVGFVRLRIEIEQEDDGRWLAEVMALPGVMAYGETSEQASASAKALALRVLADKLQHGELDTAVY